jgi:hypothetical protein
MLEPVVVRYRRTVKRLYFGDDAAFANPEMYEFLEAEGMGYAILLPANRALQDKTGYLLKRPVGRPPHEVRRDFASFGYQAQSWKKPRRVVEWHSRELYRALALSARARSNGPGCRQVVVRADAAFAKPEIYEILEERV